jgi:hypothetical protein
MFQVSSFSKAETKVRRRGQVRDGRTECDRGKICIFNGKEMETAYI